MAELDLSSFLKDASVADLDWLDVDEVEYRNQDHLPKQNLDIQPDLEAFWAREGESPTTYLVPNVVPVPNVGIEDPHTMGDMSQVHGKLRNQAEEIAKVARLSLMQSDDLTSVRTAMLKRYPLEVLRQHREVLGGVLKERGLLGHYYVVAEDFTGVDQAKATAFINKYASTSRYVLSKTACGGCAHCNTAQPGSAGHCSQFNRELVTEVPYTGKLAATIEKLQAARGRIIQSSEGSFTTREERQAAAKERIRAAYLAPTPERSGQYTGLGVSQQHQVTVEPAVAKEQLISAASLNRKKQAALDAKPIIDFLNREMSNGSTWQGLASKIKVAFDRDLLIRTKEHWGPLYKEVDKTLKSAREEIMQSDEPQMAPSRMDVQRAFYGNSVGHSTSGLTRREIVKTASKYMNEGLYGADLMSLLKSKFEVRDLVAAKDDLRVVLAEQGLQGIYYVDPTAYDDYGKGCNEASRLHGTRMVEYVKLGAKCGSCVHQINAGFCSKINKRLTNEPPYVDKKAQQREVLASGSSTENTYASLMNNGTSMIAEYQMQNEMSVEVNASEEVRDVTVMFGTGIVKLK